MNELLTQTVCRSPVIGMLPAFESSSLSQESSMDLPSGNTGVLQTVRRGLGTLAHAVGGLLGDPNVVETNWRFVTRTERKGVPLRRKVVFAALLLTLAVTACGAPARVPDVNDPKYTPIYPSAPTSTPEYLYQGVPAPTETRDPRQTVVIPAPTSPVPPVPTPPPLPTFTPAPPPTPCPTVAPASCQNGIITKRCDPYGCPKCVKDDWACVDSD